MTKIKNLIVKGIKYVTDADYRAYCQGMLGRSNPKLDEKFIKARWKDFYGYEIDLENPKTLSEKLQWLKLYDRKWEYVTIADKYAVKEFVAERVGEEHIIPTLKVWDRAEDIDIAELPEKFILKTTHDSGGFIICKDKSSFNLEEAKEFFRGRLKHNHYIANREWPYKHVMPRIIAEPLIEGLGDLDSVEYKVTCFNGKVAFVTICRGIAHAGFDDRTNDHFDRNRQKMDWYTYYKPAKETPEIPKEWDQIVEFSEKLAKDIPYIRVDMYIINGKILFGEMTFFTWGGYLRFEPIEWDLKLGEMLELPKHKEIRD